MKKEVIIEAKRNGYSPEQCGNTLTVGELIGILQGLDEDAKIYLSHDNGYTFGNLTEQSFEEYESEEE